MCVIFISFLVLYYISDVIVVVDSYVYLLVISRAVEEHIN